MTRGMKGCYVYFTEQAAERLFRSRLTSNIAAPPLSKVAEPEVPYNEKPSPRET
jgi:hypothetical protein